MRRLLQRLVDALRWLPVGLLLLVVLVLADVLPRNGPTYAERTAVGEAWREDGFTVAVVWPEHDTPDFVEGARLAWEIVDREPGPLAGKIRFRTFTERASDAGGSLATRVALDGTVLVVLGHEVGEHIVPASLVYEQHGILFLTPRGAHPRATGHNFQYVFRLTPGDVQIGDAIARYAAGAGYKRVGIVYARTERGESAARQFGSKAAEQGIVVPFSRSYHHPDGRGEKPDFRPLAAEVRQHSFDALLVADELPYAGTLVRDLVQMGVAEPLLAMALLDPAELWRIAGTAASHVFVASGFEPTTAAPEYGAFHARFIERFGSEPSYGAMQGYEAFMLAVKACLKSRDASPLVLATTIRLADAWSGLSGDFSFTAEGEVVGRPIAINRVQASGFETVYSWEGSEE